MQEEPFLIDFLQLKMKYLTNTTLRYDTKHSTIRYDIKNTTIRYNIKHTTIRYDIKNTTTRYDTKKSHTLQWCLLLLQVSTHPLTGGWMRATASMGRLAQLGYNRALHPAFSKFIVNIYWILEQRPDMNYNNVDVLIIIISTAPGKLVPDLLLLLSCLTEMARKPLLMW